MFIFLFCTLSSTLKYLLAAVAGRQGVDSNTVLAVGNLSRTVKVPKCH